MQSGPLLCVQMEKANIEEGLRGKHSQLVKLWLTCTSLDEASQRFRDLMEWYVEKLEGNALVAVQNWRGFWQRR
jgi:hypothetical protein